LVEPTISWIKYFPVNDQQSIIAAEIKDPNIGWGAKLFNYQIDVYDKNNLKIASLKNDSFIYPAEIKYLFDIIQIKFQDIHHTKTNFSDFQWTPLKNFSQLDIKIREAKPGIIIPMAAKFLLKTLSLIIIHNNNPFKLSKLKIIGFLRNNQGQYVSASKTQLENKE